jgi:hypothetical protein
MSVVLGETPKQQPHDSALKADSETELAASLPLTITLWMYFDQPPAASETHTLYWYGDTGSQVNHLALEATKNASATGIDITAKLQGSTGSVSATATQVPGGEWMMLTVIVAAEGQASHRVTLYVNDTQEDTAATNVGTVTPGAYDRFILGARESGFNFGRFRAEHVAIWAPVERESVLEPLTGGEGGEIEQLYEERWAPITPPDVHSIGRNPGIAYWMLAGHWSGGIEAANDQGTGTGARNAGLLFNQANPDGQIGKPPLQMLDTSKPVVWSAKTPVMKYLIAQPMAPGPLTHPPIPPVSRLQPHFYIFNTTGPLGTHKYPALEIPLFTHPNFIPHGSSRGQGANAPGVPVVDDPVTYLPSTDTAIIAKRVADFIEFAGLKRGVGSVGDGAYEGYVEVHDVGLGDVATVNQTGQPDTHHLRGYRGPDIVTPDGQSPFKTWGSFVPLELSPLDLVEPDGSRESNRPWETWFNFHGKRLLKDYMDGFWIALKRELDERDLCYPRVLWWDMEDWARGSQFVRADSGVSHGTFTLQLGDARYSSEPLMGGATLSTLEEIWTATKPSTPAAGYDDDKNIGDAENEEFYRWMLGWSVAITQQAVWEAMMEKAKDVFPETVWSNYDRFAADNPQFPYPGGNARELFNTPPAAQAFIHGDYSSPKLYTGALEGMVNGSTRLMPELGVTYIQVLRNWQKARIDACINAFSAKPLAPHFETGIREIESGTHLLSTDDVYDIFAYAWKRGVDNFVPFVFVDPPGTGDPSDNDKKQAQDNMYEVCFRLLNYVHWLPQENHARVARVSRRGW